MNGLAWVIAPGQAVQFMLILARLAGVFAAAPIFSHHGAPMRVRVGVAIGIALAFAGHVPAEAAADITTVWELAGATLLEAATGVMLGLAPSGLACRSTGWRFPSGPASPMSGHPSSHVTGFKCTTRP